MSRLDFTGSGVALPLFCYIAPKGHLSSLPTERRLLTHDRQAFVPVLPENHFEASVAAGDPYSRIRVRQVPAAHLAMAALLSAHLAELAASIPAATPFPP